MNKKRKEMGEEAWEEYQRVRKNEKALRHKKKNSLSVITHRRRKKKRLIDYKGGECTDCGYQSKHMSAYCFHHVNPEDKEINIASNMQLKFDTLIKEVDKCVLLCVRCHAELHDKEYEESLKIRVEEYKNLTNKEILQKAKSTSNKKKKTECAGCDLFFLPKKTQQRYCTRECYFKNIDQEAAKRIKTPKPSKICKTCPKEISKNATMCQKCASLDNGKLRRKVLTRPSKEELQKMIDTMSWCAIGRKYEVSDNAIRKWARSYGIL